MFAFAMLSTSRLAGDLKQGLRRRPLIKYPTDFVPGPFLRPTWKNAEEQEDPDNFIPLAPIAVWLAQQAAIGAGSHFLLKGGKMIYDRLRHQEAESNYVPPLFNAEEQEDQDNCVGIILRFVAGQLLQGVAKGVFKHYFHQEAESNYVPPSFNAEEQEDQENIWPLVARIVGGAALQWILSRQEAESNYVPPSFNAEEQQDQDNIIGAIVNWAIKQGIQKAGDAISQYILSHQEAESNGGMPECIREIYSRPQPRFGPSIKIMRPPVFKLKK